MKKTSDQTLRDLKFIQRHLLRFMVVNELPTYRHASNFFNLESEISQLSIERNLTLILGYQGGLLYWNSKTMPAQSFIHDLRLKLDTALCNQFFENTSLYNFDQPPPKNIIEVRRQISLPYIQRIKESFTKLLFKLDISPNLKKVELYDEVLYQLDLQTISPSRLQSVIESSPEGLNLRRKGKVQGFSVSLLKSLDSKIQSVLEM